MRTSAVLPERGQGNDEGGRDAGLAARRGWAADTGPTGLGDTRPPPDEDVMDSGRDTGVCILVRRDHNCDSGRSSSESESPWPGGAAGEVMISWDEPVLIWRDVRLASAADGGEPSGAELDRGTAGRDGSVSSFPELRREGERGDGLRGGPVGVGASRSAEAAEGRSENVDEARLPGPTSSPTGPGEAPARCASHGAVRRAALEAETDAAEPTLAVESVEKRLVWAVRGGVGDSWVDDMIEAEEKRLSALAVVAVCARLLDGGGCAAVW